MPGYDRQYRRLCRWEDLKEIGVGTRNWVEYFKIEIFLELQVA